MDHEHDSAERSVSRGNNDQERTERLARSEGGPDLSDELRTTGEKLIASLVINEYGKDKREYRIAEDTVRIGRDPEGDIVLWDVAVSRSHAQIVRQGNVFFLKDLGSRNGVLLNDSRLPERSTIRLHSGDRIQLGRSMLRFIAKLGAKITSRARRARESVPTVTGRGVERTRPQERALCLFQLHGLKAALLVVGERGATERFWLGSDQTTIGRSPESDVTLANPKVSKHHAEIVYNSEGFHLVDRNSAFGTFLDGMSVHVARLAHRSFVRFGTQKALFAIRDEGKDPPEVSFRLRNHLMEYYPEKAARIQEAFKPCRERALDFAEELVERGVLDPEEWWTATREFKDESTSGVKGWVAKILSRKRK